VTVNTTDPIIVYCAQNANTHCKNGMVAVINPRGNNTFNTYLNAARQAGNSTSPPSVFGGVFAKIGDPQGSTTTAPDPTATPPSPTATATASETATNVAGSLGASLAGLAAGLAGAVIFV